MNQRIEKLAVDAGLLNYVDNETPRRYFVNGYADLEEVEKFAELIVRECANHCDLLLDHKISSEWARGTHDCSKAIKKHFGVEE
jgi:hypothetical protein